MNSAAGKINLEDGIKKYTTNISPEIKNPMGNKIHARSPFIFLLAQHVAFAVSSCTSHKQLVYLKNVDSTSTENYFPSNR